jgi:hypothetical protein
MADQVKEEAAPSKVALTKDGSHVATAKGYAAGVIIEEGQPVPAGVPVALEDELPSGWMVPARKRKADDE